MYCKKFFVFWFCINRFTTEEDRPSAVFGHETHIVSELRAKQNDNQMFLKQSIRNSPSWYILYLHTECVGILLSQGAPVLFEECWE